MPTHEFPPVQLSTLQGSNLLNPPPRKILVQLGTAEPRLMSVSTEYDVNRRAVVLHLEECLQDWEGVAGSDAEACNG